MSGTNEKIQVAPLCSEGDTVTLSLDSRAVAFNARKRAEQTDR